MPPSGSSAICFSHETRSFRSFSSPADAGSSGRSGRVAPSRCISTADGNGSTSAKNAGVHPRCRQARLAASTPLQILPYFILRMILWMGGECLHPVHTQKFGKRSHLFPFFLQKKAEQCFSLPRAEEFPNGSHHGWCVFKTDAAASRTLSFSNLGSTTTNFPA